MVMVKVKDKEFYLDGHLKKRLDNVKHIVRNKNFDCVFIVDGLERVGKSTLAITCAYYLSDGKFSIKNIAVDSADAVRKIESLPNKSVLLVDEGSLVFNSRDSMTKEQKKLIKIMNVVGQKNMIFIIVLPSIFDLNKSIAVRRSKFLLHCYTDPSLNRGRFGYFGESQKKMLYGVGKKNYDSYQFPKLSSGDLGRYSDFNPLGKEYLEAKKKSLYSSLHDDDKVDVRKEITYRFILSLESYKFPFKVTQEMKANMIGLERTNYNKLLKSAKI